MSRIGPNNPMYGRKHSETTKQKMRLKALGNNNSQWKGDKVGYVSLHEWLRNHLLRPELCQICKKVSPYDISNKTGNYLRNLNDWQWLCRKCHMLYDFNNGMRKY